jgi:hypothetical protein
MIRLYTIVILYDGILCMEHGISNRTKQEA